jgi:hypothetical protein
MNISFFDEKPNLDDLDFKLPLLEKYKNINVDEMSNLLFYGPPSSGKTIKIYALLASIFDKKVYDLKNITYEEDRKIIIYKASIYHIEINPINLGSNEKLFIQGFLKSYIQTRNIGLDIPKIILIKNAHQLTKQTQMALRKYIEKYIYTCKFIFEVNNLSCFLDTLVSRCMLFRIPLPKYEDIKLCIKNFSKRGNISIDDIMIDEIIRESNKISKSYNLKKIFGYYLYYVSTNKKFIFLYYDKFFEILNYINNIKISFISLQKIRELVNEMYINLIPMEELMLFLFYKILDIYKGNNIFIHNFINLSVTCNIQLKKGNKECLHIEYYIISIIELIHNSKILK